MRASPRKVKLLILLLPPAIFLLMASLYSIRQARSVVNAFPQILTSELTEMLGRDVYVGAASVSSKGYAVLNDIRINEPKPSKEPFVMAREIRVRFSPNKLLTGRSKPLAAIKEVRISDLRIILRRNQKREWNISKLLKSEKPEEPPDFRGSLKINGLEIILDDKSAEQKPNTVHFGNLSAILDFTTMPLFTYSLHGQDISPVLKNLKAGGSRNYKDLTTSASADFSGADMRWWLQYGKKSTWAKVTSGIATGKIRLTLVDNRPLVSGKIKVAEGGLFLYPIGEYANNIGGSIQFAQAGVKFNVHGDIRRSRILSFGSVDLKRPIALDITLKSKSVGSDLTNALIKRFWNASILVTGQSSFDARVRGTMPDLSVEFNTKTARVSSYGRQAENILLSGVYRSGRLGFSQASLKHKNGSIALRGVIFTKGSKSMNLEGDFRRIPVAAFVQHQKSILGSIGGFLAGKFIVKGNPENPSIRFLVTPSTITVGDTQVFVKMAEGFWHKGSAEIRQSLVEVAGGVISVSGDIKAGRVNLDTKLANISIRKLGYKQLSKLGGYAFGSVGLSGSIASPKVSVDLRVYSPEYGDVKYNKASINAEISGGNVAIKSFTASAYPSDFHANGTLFIYRGQPLRFKINADLSKIDVSDLKALFSIESPISGLMDAKLTAAGSLLDFNAEGKASLSYGFYGEYSIHNAKVSFKHGRSGTQIFDFHTKTDLGSWSGSGNISQAKNLQFVVNGTNIPLDSLNAKTRHYAVFSGLAEMQGTVGGSIDAPSVQGNAFSNSFTVNNVPIKNFDAWFSWNDNILKVPSLHFETDGSYSVNDLEFDSRDNSLSAKAKISSASLNNIANIIRYSQFTHQDSEIQPLIARLPASITGVLDLSADIGITQENRQADIKAELHDAIIGGAEAGAVDLDLLYKNDIVSIKKLRLSGPEMDLTAEGEVASNGHINRLDLSARNLSTNLLKQFVKMPNVVGLVNLDLTAEGNISSPNIIGSADIASATVYGRKFDLLSVSRFATSPSDNGLTSLELSDIVFSTAAYDGQPGLSGRAEGSIPWDWNERKIPSDKPISFLIESRKQSTAALAALYADTFNPIKTSGSFSIDLNLSSEEGKWNAFGKMNIQDTVLSIRALNTPFTDLNGEIVFDGTTARITSFTGKSDAGGSFKLQGFAEDRDTGEVFLKSELQAKDLVVKGENISRIYDERIDVKINTDDLTLVGKLKEPLISGQVSFRDAFVKVRGKQEKQRAPLSIPINPLFDIKFSVGPNAVLNNPRLFMALNGEGFLKGSLKSPDLKAYLRVARGFFNLPTSRLRITPGGTMTVSYAPPANPRVYLDLQARTSAYVVSQLGTTQRYEILMDISGNPTEPKIEVSSNPPGLSQNRIIGLLGHLDVFTDDGRNALRADIADVFTAAATPFLFSPIEIAVTEALGLEEFSIEYAPNQPFALYFSTRLGGNFYGSYRRQVGVVNEEYEIGLGYRFSPSLQSVLSLDHKNILRLQIAGTRRF